MDILFCKDRVIKESLLGKVPVFERVLNHDQYFIVKMHEQ